MKAKAIFLSIIGIVLLLSVFIYSSLNGNPATKENSRELVSAYLKENYPDESFKITNISYYPGEGTYIVHVISKDGKIEGNIDVRNGRIRTEGAEFPFRQ
ncbi:hypothetical protein QNH48_04190 [Neobacillus sp. YX16]|uniref:YfjL-like protein n=1 Tax=Neobacillus sp. YX16 TaxID=3047874 RepID=UPI0024C25B29|nr:hypothetical protein [Neobacillus sp. YX16]WHZ03871.1 hypothetical protein QNH48_04190 [Neobacillus sp. YX16]